MKKLFKRIIPCLIVVLSIFAIVSCKDDTKYKYPDPVPLYTSNGIFAEIGNLKISNQDIYNRLLQSYGIEELENAIDAELLKDVVLTDDQEKDFQDQMKNLIYGTVDVEELTEEEKADAEKSFKLDMISNGLNIDDKTSSLYYENYYRLDYKRYVKTLEVLTAEIKEADAELEEDEEPYFTDSDYLSYFTSNFHKTYKLIIVTFESEKEAIETMKNAGINVDSLLGGWKNADNQALTNEQVVEAFKVMYKKAYKEECTGATEYTYADLLKIQGSSSSSAIANKAVNLENGEYTEGPLSYSDRFFLMYAEEVDSAYVYDIDETFKVEDNETYIAEKDADNNIVEITDALKEKLFSYLVDNILAISSSAYENNINRVMYELRQAAGLEIFAEGLEIEYKSAYDTVFSTLDITDYEAFKATENTSSTEIAKWNGGSLTVDEMFNALTSRYGAVITLLFVQQYVILNSEHNKVVNYITGEVLDQEKYDEYFEEDLESYKESFENGDFETYGYPSSYGWTNFLRDYLGLTEEAAIIVDFNSTLYDDVLALYTKALYMAEVGDVEAVVLTGDEGVKTWGLKSAKWALTHDTGVKVVDENVLPAITLAWEEADIEGVPNVDENNKPVVYAKNDYYGHFVLTTADGKYLTDVTADQAVLEAYDDIYAETFSATASGVYVYYDKDFDGTADEFAEDDALATSAQQLVTLVWKAAKELYDAKDYSHKESMTTYLNIVLREFELASEDSYSVWYSYKQEGLRVKIISGSTYSNSSSAHENILTVVKGMWSDIVNYNDEDGTATSLTGQNLDPVYRYVKNSKVYNVTPYTFADKYGSFYADNGFYQLAVTKATARTAYEYKTSTKQQKPSLYIYEQYQLDSDVRDITINCSSQITTYYSPAITRVAGSDVVNKSILTSAKELLSSVKFTENNTKLHADLTYLVEAALEELDAE
ncbi:MAG: hypothetical protein IJB21_07070 [Bacilli bacterium]|nr:hypothetical protein [Bacilli bacterium]